MSRETLADRTRVGVYWSTIDSTVQQILTLVIFVVLGRLLDPSVFGIVSTCLVVVFFARSVLLGAVSTALVSIRGATDEDFSTGFWLCFGISVGAVVFLNIAAGPVARLYNHPDFSYVIRITSILVLFSGLSYAHSAWGRKNFLFKLVAMRNTISTSAAGAVSILVASLGYGLAALVVNQILSGVLALMLLWRAIPWRPRFYFGPSRAKLIITTALPLGLNQSLQFITQNFDTAIITYLLGPFGGGLYAAAKRVVLAVQIALLQPMSSVALPAFAEVAGDPVRLGNATIRMSRLVMALTAPLFAGIALTASVSVMVLFGPKWIGAAPIMAVLASFALFAPSVGVLQQIVITLGRSKIILLTTLMQMALSLVAIGMMGRLSPSMVAVCLTGPVLVTLIVTLMVLTRITAFPLRRYFLAIGQPLACTAIMAGAVLLVPNLRMGPLAQLVAMAVVGGAVYVAASLILAREAVAELSEFARTLMRKRGHKEQAA